MNETYVVLAKWTRRKKTQALVDKLHRILRKYDGKTTLAAMLVVLVDVHLSVNEGPGGKLCVPCTNASLTELIQTLRGFHDEAVDAVPSGLVSKVPHHEDKKEE